ncbi:MAG: adenosine deaminase family protein [Deltaproteobacteria bacterium]|nr:adenosine deaminase family protein [Deltaproteobacteria bacterium]
MADPLPPLADLHRHLDGSLRPETLSDLASQQGVTLPEDIKFYRGMGLDEALARFSVILSVLQEPAAVRRVAAEICEDAARDGVTTLEIRFGPQLHRGGVPGEIIDAALDGIAGRAGLILCGLYGEPPRVLAELVALAAERPAVVGIDLAGGPTTSHRWALTDYTEPFERARQLGIGRTVHAAEGRPAHEIRVAVEQLHAQRIGHGTTLLDDPAVVDLVRQRDVTIEACPTSNVHTGVIGEVGDHPLPHWAAAGVRVCVCPDNTLLSDVTARQEHERVASIPGMDDDTLAQVIAWGHEGAFSRR